MGVLQSGVVLAVKVAGVQGVPAAERAAYHAALVALAGEDVGRNIRAWLKYVSGARASAARPRQPERTEPSTENVTTPAR